MIEDEEKRVDQPGGLTLDEQSKRGEGHQEPRVRQRENDVHEKVSQAVQEIKQNWLMEHETQAGIKRETEEYVAGQRAETKAFIESLDNESAKAEREALMLELQQSAGDAEAVQRILKRMTELM